MEAVPDILLEKETKERRRKWDKAAEGKWMEKESNRTTENTIRSISWFASYSYFVSHLILMKDRRNRLIEERMNEFQLIKGNSELFSFLLSFIFLSIYSSFFFSKHAFITVPSIILHHILSCWIIHKGESFKRFIQRSEVCISDIRWDYPRQKKNNKILTKIPTDISNTKYSPTGSMEVNSSSNWEVSSDDAIDGTHGGGILPVARAVQFTSEKKGCSFSSCASRSPDPNLCFGSLTSKRESKFVAA